MNSEEWKRHKRAMIWQDVCWIISHAGMFLAGALFLLILFWIIL